MKSLKLTPTKAKVLLDSLNAVAWGALPAKHPERIAVAELISELQPKSVTLNMEQRLYVIPSGDGYSCLGFDVAYLRAQDVLNWLQAEVAPMPIKMALHDHHIGTMHGYNEYKAVMAEAGVYAGRNKKRCPTQLTPELVGLEGKRVEVVDCYGGTRQFRVGKSTGWLPIHLEVEGDGGPAAMGTPYKSVRVVEGK